MRPSKNKIISENKKHSVPLCQSSISILFQNRVPMHTQKGFRFSCAHEYTLLLQFSLLDGLSPPSPFSSPYTCVCANACTVLYRRTETNRPADEYALLETIQIRREWGEILVRSIEVEARGSALSLYSPCRRKRIVLFNLLHAARIYIGIFGQAQTFDHSFHVCRLGWVIFYYSESHSHSCRGTLHKR